MKKFSACLTVLLVFLLSLTAYSVTLRPMSCQFDYGHPGLNVYAIVTNTDTGHVFEANAREDRDEPGLYRIIGNRAWHVGNYQCLFYIRTGSQPDPARDIYIGADQVKSE